MSSLDPRKLFNKQSLIILMMGLSSGLPLALTGGTLQAWMKSEQVSLATIGLFALVGLPYTWKFIWAPVMDRFALGKAGRRKAWMLVSQLFLIGSILYMSVCDPHANLPEIAFAAFMVAFWSATQDIVLDAWRRESVPTEQFGWATSVHISGYLFGMRMISGALALILSDFLPWSQVFQILAAVQCVGLVATFFCREPKVEIQPRTLKETVIEPFVDYFRKPGAWLILVFILLYKAGDVMAGHMTIPFYLDIGFTKTEVGAISKLVGWASVFIGGMLGGLLMARIKIVPSLVVCGVLQAISTFGFVWLAIVGKSEWVLTFVIAFENLTAGMGTTAFVAFMGSITSRKFTATQYALLTSLMGVPRIFLAAPTGLFAERLGWVGFFILCTLIAIPGILLIGPMSRRQASEVE